MNVVERKLSKMHKYKKIVSIFTLILILLSGVLSQSVYALSFIWPAPGHSRITSHFRTPERPTHNGIDIGAPSNSSIIASEDGEVINTGYNNISGNLVSIKHADGFVTNYFHNNKILVKKGQKVKKGDVIARSGSTGKSRGPHLHFEVVLNGEHKNPVNYVSYDGTIEPNNNPTGDDEIENANFRDPKEYGSGYAANGLNTITNENFFYQGAPKGHYQAKGSTLQQIINFFATIGRYLISLFLNILFKLPFLGYASLAEVMITSLFNAVAGEEQYINRGTNTDLYIDPRRSVNVENIIFGRVELLNIDFFVDPQKAEERMEGLTGSGQSIEIIQERASISGNSGTATEYDAQRPEYEESVIGTLRRNYAKIYYIIFSICIVMMIFTMLGIGIATLVSSMPGKKAQYKEYLLDWLKGLATMLLSLVFVFFVIKINQFFLKILEEFSKTMLKDGILQETASIYETVRTRAYDNKFTIGFPATVVYIILVWDTIKFSFIYIKRLIYTLILAVMGPISNTFQIVSNIFSQKPGNRSKISGWIKEFTYLVMLQSIHAAIYTFIMIVVFKLLEDISIINFIMLIGLHTMLYELPKYLKDIFKISDGGGSAISDTTKTNPVKESSAILAAATGKEFSETLSKNAIYDGKKIIKGAVNISKKAATETGKGVINFGLFLNDAIRERKVKNIEKDLEKFDPEIKKLRDEKVEKIVQMIEENGLETIGIRSALNMLSTAEIEKLLNDPNRINEFAVNMENADLKEIFANQDLKLSEGKSSREIKRELAENREQKALEALENTKPFFMDENGRYRILSPIKAYNPKTGKYDVIAPGSSEYFKNLGKAFGVDKEKYKEAGRVTIDTFQTGLSIIAAGLVIPGLLGDINGAKDILGTWAGLHAFGKSTDKTKPNIFKVTSDDFKKYVIPYKKKKKNKKVRDAIDRILRKRYSDGTIFWKDAKVIIDDAKNEIIEMQYNEIKEAVWDIDKRDFKNSLKIQKGNKYTYEKRVDSIDLPKKVRLRREQNKVLAELESLNILELENQISDNLKHADTYFKITNGNIDDKSFEEYFDIDILSAQKEEAELTRKIYEDIIKIKKKTRQKRLEAEAYRLGKDKIEKIKNDEINQIYNKIEELAVGKDEEYIKDKKLTASKNLLEVEELAKNIEKEKIDLEEKEGLNNLIESYEDKNLIEVFDDYDKNQIKINMPNNKRNIEIVSSSINKLTDIYEDQIDRETIKKIGKKEFDEAKEIESKIIKETLAEKFEEIDKLDLEEEDKQKIIEDIKQNTNLLNIKEEDKEKYLTKEEKEKLEKYEDARKVSIKETNSKNIKEVVEDWKKDSKDVVSGIEKLNEKYNIELEKKLKVLDAMKDPDNLVKVFGNQVSKNKNEKVQLKVEKDFRTEEEKSEERTKKLQNILDKFYKK